MSPDVSRLGVDYMCNPAPISKAKVRGVLISGEYGVELVPF